tara:strand:- start:228 stop:1343 length:1116 start_codon:yes stop_codon:yes gene_type:complete
MALSKISNDMFTTISRPNSTSLIVNGDMAVAQRNTSATGKTGSGYYTCDRWNMSASSLGTWTQTQDTDVPTGYGFANSLKMDCTTADSSPGSGDNLALQYSFEGQALQLLKKGTASAEKLTLTFWVKSVKTGTYIVEFYDHDNNRQISTAYTVSQASTWEQKIINIDGDTTGALGNDNAQSLSIQFHLAAGSNYTSGTLNTSWAGNTNANRMVGQVNLGDSTSNNFWITGVQLEIGEFSSTSIPPFQHESFGDNLARCQRYAYEVVSNESAAGNAPIGVGGAQYNSGQMQFSITFPVPMRTNPSLTCSSASNNYSFIRNDAADNFDDFVIDKANSNMAECKNSTDMSGTAGHSGVVRTANSSLSVLFTAEL